MSITSAVSTDSSSWSVSELLSTSSVSSTSDTSSTSGVSSSSGSDSIDLSDPAKLYSKLKTLQESDPDKFKEVCASIADQLESAAGDDEMLSDLADKFQSVADGGDISVLEPPSPPSGQTNGASSGIDRYQQQSAMGAPPPKPSEDAEDLLSSIMSQVDDALDSVS